MIHTFIFERFSLLFLFFFLSQYVHGIPIGQFTMRSTDNENFAPFALSKNSEVFDCFAQFRLFFQHFILIAYILFLFLFLIHAIPSHTNIRAIDLISIHCYKVYVQFFRNIMNNLIAIFILTINFICLLEKCYINSTFLLKLLKQL